MQSITSCTIKISSKIVQKNYTKTPWSTGVVSVLSSPKQTQQEEHGHTLASVTSKVSDQVTHWSLTLHEHRCKRSTLIFLLKFRCARFCWNLCSSCLRSSSVNLPTLLVSIPYTGDEFPPPTCIAVDLCTQSRNQMTMKISKDSPFFSSRGISE
jgi:hypothetical protein